MGIMIVEFKKKMYCFKCADKVYYIECNDSLSLNFFYKKKLDNSLTQISKCKYNPTLINIKGGKYHEENNN